MSDVRGRWWLLCEDSLHERFAITLMDLLKFRRKPVKVFRPPQGRGAAVSWVIHQFPQVCANTTRQRPSERVALVVMVDGDNEGVAGRLPRLDEALRTAEQSVRKNEEPIVIFVPTWSIETWLLESDPSITEAVSLKSRLPEVTREHLRRAAHRIRQLDPDEPLPSLRAASDELRRLPDL